MAHMILVDNLIKSLENGEYVLGVFLDFINLYKKRCVRIITFSGYRDHTDPLFLGYWKFPISTNIY